MTVEPAGGLEQGTKPDARGEGAPHPQPLTEEGPAAVAREVGVSALLVR
jgi:hypothetical protein